MSQVVQAVCPGCRSILRIPSEWLSQPIRCKNCGTVVQARTPAAVPPLPAPRPSSNGPSNKTPIPATRKAAPPVPSLPPQAPQAIAAPPGFAPPPLAVPVGAASGASFSFDQSHSGDEGPGLIAPKRARRKKGGGSWVGFAILGVVLLVAGGITAAMWGRIKPIFDKVKKGESIAEDLGVSNSGKKSSKKKPLKKSVASNDGGKASGSPANKGAKGGSNEFPRRVLLISVHNYLYANPIPAGRATGLKGAGNVQDTDTETGIWRLKRSLASGLRISVKQIFHLSDAAEKPVPPLKSAILTGLKNFLGTCRKQDRVMVFFIGHATEVEGKAYLMPLEGEFKNAKTLLPLSDVYDLMRKCKARQKVLVVDGNRFNPGQGLERPAPGSMGKKFEAELKAPPQGVQVWASCSADQQSWVTDDMPLGVFIDSIRLALTPEKGFKAALEGTVQEENDIIPLEKLQARVVENMTAELKKRKLDGKEEIKQVAILSGKIPPKGADYDPKELPAPEPAMPVLSKADTAVVKDILSEISVPPLKGGEGSSLDVSFTVLPPFPKAAMKPFEGQLPADSKLRKAVQKTRAVLWAVSTATPPEDIKAEVEMVRKDLKVDLSIMQERYNKPAPGAAENAFKNKVFEDGKEMSRIVSELEDVLEELKAVEEEKKDAPKRWQANYDFILARLQATMAYLNEYQSALGQIRKDFPTPFDEKLHSGWRLASTTSMQGDAATKKLAKASNKDYTKMTDKYAGTPWEVLAKREQLTALGLEWKPAR